MSAKRCRAFSGMPVFESSLEHLIRLTYSRDSISVCLESWNVEGSMYCRSMMIRLQPLSSWRSIGRPDRQWSNWIFGEPFKKLGLDLTPVRSRIAFDSEEKLRITPGFQEIWSLDFPLEKLSPRRQNAKFRWINRL
jgi:hypothetical protein